MKQYEQYGIMKELAQSLATTMARTKQTYAVNWFNLQLAGSGDYWNSTAAKYLFSATHATVPSTYSNLVSGALSVAKLQEALYTLYMTPDDRGQAMGILPKRLWVHPNKYSLAIETVNKFFSLPADTGIYTKNAFDITANGIDIVACEFLTDTDGWILQGNINGAICEESVGLETSHYDVDADTSTVYDAIFAFAVGAKDWRGWVGSQGA